MRLDEPARRSLYEALARTLGDSQADTLMNLLPSHPLADMATRDDVHSLAIALRGGISELRGELKGEMAELSGQMGELRSELKGEMAELSGQMGELRSELKGEMAELRGQMGELRSELKGEMALGFGRIDRQFGEIQAQFARDLHRNNTVTITTMLALAAIFVTLAVSGMLG